MKQILLGTLIFVITMFVNCASTSKEKSNFTFQKNTSYRSDLKKVATAYVIVNSTNAAFDKKDAGIATLQSLVTSKIDEIYGAGVAGGETLVALAKKLKLSDNWNSVITDVSNLAKSNVEANLDLTPESKKTLDTMISKGNIDAIAFPFVSEDTLALEKGNSISLGILVYDQKTTSILYKAKHAEIKLSDETIKLFVTSPNNAKAKANAELLQAGLLFGDNLQKEIKSKPGTVPTSGPQPNSETVAAPSATEVKPDGEKPDEEKTKFDKYAPPGIFGFVALLWLILP